MKKLIFTLAGLLMTVVFATAQDFKVLLVDADDYVYEIDQVYQALVNSGYSFDTVNFSEAANVDWSQYDLVLWYAGNDGVQDSLWNYDDTTFKAYIVDYVNNGGILWIDGLDVIYDVYGGAPDTFNTGDFVYDFLGISIYLSQSKVDDGGVGVSKMVKCSTNDINNLSEITWVWSTLWYADGYEIVDDAVGLYEMGGESDYPLLGQITSFYKENVIFTNYRLGKVATQNIADQLVKETLDAAANGTFSGNTPVFDVFDNILVYPNPTDQYLTITLQDVKSAQFSLLDITGRKVMSKTLRNGNNTLDVSEFTPGVYMIEIISQNKRYTSKLIIK